MSPGPTGSRPVAPGAARAGAALLLAACGACGAGVTQPVAYSHRVHVKQLEMDCAACHQTSRDGEAAGLPTTSTCSSCHQEANGTSPEERKVVEAVQAGRDLPWVRLYQLPRHVYFTHRRHVAVAAIACERCHGDMGQQARPPPRALVALGMDACLQCHLERGAGRNCDECHR